MEIWYINLRKSLETLTSLIVYKKLVNHFKKVGYLNIMLQTASLVVNPIVE